MGDRRSLAQAAGRLARLACLAAALVAWSSPAAARQPAAPGRDDPLAPFTAEYSVEVKGLPVGTLRRSLATDGGLMHYHSELTASGIAALFWHRRETEDSRWRVTADGTLQPVSYRYRRDGGRRPKQVVIEFDWRRRQMQVTVNGRHRREPLAATLHDRLLYELAMMRDLAAGAPRLRYRIADGGKVKVYEFARDGQERLRTRAGTFDTVRLVRHKPGSRRRTTVWSAPRLGFLPVRVEHVDGKGTTVRATLRRLEGAQRDQDWPAPSMRMRRGAGM